MCCLSLLLLLGVFNNNNYVRAKIDQASPSPEDESVYSKYVEMDEDLKLWVNRTLNEFLPQLMKKTENLVLTPSCRRDASQWLSGIENLQVSALKILDASGKYPAGVLNGNFHSLGNYEECMTTSVLQGDGNVAFNGQYCLLFVSPLLPPKRTSYNLNHRLERLIDATKNTSQMTQWLASSAHLFYEYPIHYGLCVPSGCTLDDVALMVNSVTEDAYMNASVMHCSQQDTEDDFNREKIILVVVTLSVGLLVLVGSSIDYFSKKKRIAFNNTGARLLMCFSIMSNFPKAISTKTPSNSLNCLYGIRCLSLFYIVLFHEWYFGKRYTVPGNAIRLFNTFSEFFMQVVFQGNITVEVFFFLGGLLNVYNRMKERESGRDKKNVLERIIHRLWRIYPAHLFCMVIVCIFAYTRGPLADLGKAKELYPCRRHWWKNLLFINNFFRFQNQCLVQYWYVAVDMHLYLVSLITVPVLLRCAKKGIILHSTVLALGLIGTVTWAWHEDITPSHLPSEFRKNKIVGSLAIYFSTVSHIAPYFTGMITGYILTARKDFKIPLVFQIIGWPLTGACLSTIFIPHIWSKGEDYTALEAACFYGISRFVYVLAIAWLVVCCSQGCGGIFNYVLSLKMWVPIGRISYVMYLISPSVQRYLYLQTAVLPISTTMMIWRYAATLVMFALLSLAIHVAVESPVLAMESIFFKSKKTAPEENKEKDGDSPPAIITDGHMQTQF